MLVKLSVDEVVQIEADAVDPLLRVMARLAGALDVELEDLLPWSQE
jgi:DNA-binding XRE family transcriptional regulator